MASPSYPNVYEWIRNLPPISLWSKNTMSLCLCTSESASFNLVVTKNIAKQSPEVTFSIFLEFNIPICLWTSNVFHIEATNQVILDEVTTLNLFFNILDGVLKYGPKKKSPYQQPAIQIRDDFSDILDIAILTLVVLLCVYEAPHDIKQELLDTLRLQLSTTRSLQAANRLLRALGSIIEELWMRSLNLGITKWIRELQISANPFISPFPLFSYASSASNLWKLQVFCPLVAMNYEDTSASTQDKRLLFSLNHHQLEAVVQLAHKVVFKENWVDVVVNVDNIRCDIIPLVSEALMAKEGYGAEEKHFPSRISLQLTPTLQSDVLSVSVSKSTDNPVHEVELEKALESSFTPPTSIGLSVSASETITTSMKPWKFEQSVYGNSAILNWFLHDGINGKEVCSSRPSKCALCWPRAWFRNRYSNASRLFTKQGGVIFAGDKYGESVCWKMCEGAFGKTMEWEIKGKVWLTYWPNKRKIFYTENKRLEFRELVYVSLEK